MNHVEELEFIMSLTDQVSGPMNKMMGQFSKMTNMASRGFGRVKNGAIGLAATGLLLTSAMQPAIAMDRALGEVKSLGVHEQSLQSLQQTSLEFTTKYGGDATEFVKSSYDIQSAIAGLEGAELSKFTEQSNLLAKATKSDAGTITNYMGTMYGIFENQAVQMGKSKWVSIVAGQTAAAVQMFKTTGGEMSGAFTALGAEATASGIGMNEQMAVLGRLQATMSGSEAGTKYKAFLGGVGKAQDALGLTFTDSQGKMLGVTKILDEIKGKYGEIDTVAESDELAKAFGTKEAVAMIKLLAANTDGLKNNIADLGKQTDETKAALMTGVQVDPWQRVAGGLNALRISIGSTLLPILNPLADSFADVTSQVQIWTQKFPNITRLIGLSALGVAGLAAVMAVLTIGVGIATAASAALGIVWAAIGAVFAIITSPIGLLIAGIVALVVYWDDLKAAFGDNAVFRTIESIFVGWKLLFQELAKLNPFESFSGALDWVIDKIKQLEKFNVFEFFSNDEATEQVLTESAANDALYIKSNADVTGEAPKIKTETPYLSSPEEFKRKSTVMNGEQRMTGNHIENMTITTEQAINPDSLSHMIGMGA